MKRKKTGIALVAASLLVAALLCYNLPQSLTSFDTAFNLMQIEDGSYLGSCGNGVVKVRVEVVV